MAVGTKNLDMSKVLRTPSPRDNLFGEPSAKEKEIIEKSEGDVMEIEIGKLSEYKNHTFKVITDNEDMASLIDSVKDYGIITPLIVRKAKGQKNKYEIISGHRRCYAAKEAGLKTVPCKVMELDDDMADIIMADTNLSRESILPSEKAFTYKVRLEAAVRQGKKSKDELELMAKDGPDSLSKIKRYMRLTKLDRSLLDMVDDDSLPFMAGVNLSFLSAEDQKVLVAALPKCSQGLNLKNSEKLRKAGERGLTEKKVIDILGGKLNPRRTTGKKKSPSFSEKIFDDVTPESVKALPLEERIKYYREAVRAYSEKED